MLECGHPKLAFYLYPLCPLISVFLLFFLALKNKYIFDLFVRGLQIFTTAHMGATGKESKLKTDRVFVLSKDCFGTPAFVDTCHQSIVTCLRILDTAKLIVHSSTLVFHLYFVPVEK